MPGLLDQVTDTYAREARLTPALLALAPLAISAILLWPEGDPAWKALVGVAVYCGVSLPLANLARDAGRRVEARQRAKDGGRSSAHLLRHADTRVLAPTKARYHAALSRAGLVMPTAEQERADPQAADRVYEAAVDLLLAKRPKADGQSLEFKENVAYGYRRNTLGLKPVAVAISLAALATSIAVAIHGRELTVAAAASGGAALLSLAFHSTVVRPSWVRARDVDYARQLLQTSEALP
jgi:hypothetical protein